MTALRGMATAAMLAGLAVGTASTAWADPPPMSGTYIMTAGTPPKELTLTFTPCGPTCTQFTNEKGQTATVNLVNGQWRTSFTDNTTHITDCDATVPAVNNLSWDPYTLAGQLTVTLSAPACGHQAGETANPSPLNLRKVG
jgi:hypothetical protein